MSPFNPLAFTPLKRGDKGEAVERLQGWLHLHGYDPGPVDGDFGPRTETALADAQWGNAMAWQPDLGSLDERTWRQVLTAPLARAMALLERWRPPAGALGQTVENMPRQPSLGEAVAAVARQWLAQSVGGGPLRELPGNSGPVVEACTRLLAERDRLPCVCGHGPMPHAGCGMEGAVPSDCRKLGCSCGRYRPDWRLPWCAGWVSTVLRQACESLGVEMPMGTSLSCDVLAEQADKADLLWAGEKGKASPGEVLHPGDLFLVRGAKPGDWVHCGVVLEVLPPGVQELWNKGESGYVHLEHGAIRTAEGNTAADGRRNGDRLLERIRSIDGLDFICWRQS